MRMRAVLWLLLGLALVGMMAMPALAAEAPEARPAGDGARAGLLGIAAALAVAFGALGTAWAQSRIGAAAAGAMAERPEIGGLMLVFLALPETMIILGFLVAFFLIGRI
ncbi:MAG: F0F1 ATP synthase subunit C [Armatimonadota bacterium]|nr:F0F1 ATP synthase subunit C [Armatimonadota bacterium]MDR7443451.1 F0F1 ATP synthase subunit C [Armatimonadota bacterium]MDR7569289.1 F0F1 ATP synthase subunit C [Armatimonadota bacterium]MDR7614949.1 F0F1 ATP synthase subunit C [Armatimonadota bacterium]